MSVSAETSTSYSSANFSTFDKLHLCLNMLTPSLNSSNSFLPTLHPVIIYIMPHVSLMVFEMIFALLFWSLDHKI